MDASLSNGLLRHVSVVVSSVTNSSGVRSCRSTEIVNASTSSSDATAVVPPPRDQARSLAGSVERQRPVVRALFGVAGTHAWRDCSAFGEPNQGVASDICAARCCASESPEPVKPPAVDTTR